GRRPVRILGRSATALESLTLLALFGQTAHPRHARSGGLAPVWWTVSVLASGGIAGQLGLLWRGILLFGPRRSHSSVPARMKKRPARGAAVKDGPVGPPEGLVLDGREHAGRLARVGTGTQPALVVARGEIADRGVAPAPVVEALDELEERH